MWATAGHPWLGVRVARQFGKRCALGTIVAWAPADEAEGDPALWRAEHDDGDGEDLEEHEVSEAVALYKEHPAAVRFEERVAGKSVVLECTIMRSNAMICVICNICNSFCPCKKCAWAKTTRIFGQEPQHTPRRSEGRARARGRRFSAAHRV